MLAAYDPVIWDLRGVPGRRLLDGPLQRGRERVDRRIEEDERGPDLVERARDAGPRLCRLPQERQLLPEPLVEHGGRRRWQSRIVPGLEDSANAAKRHQGGPAAGLGWMGRQDRLDPEAAQRGCGGRRLDGKASFGPKGADNPREGVVSTPAGRLPRASPAGGQDPDPMPFLGQVRQAEVEQERANDDVGRRWLEAVELLLQRPPRRRVTGSGSQRAPPRALDEPPERPTRLLVDDVEDQPPEAIDLGRQSIGFRHAASWNTPLVPSRNIRLPSGQARRVSRPDYRGNSRRWLPARGAAPLTAHATIATGAAVAGRSARFG